MKTTFKAPSYDTRITTLYRIQLSVINDDLNRAILNNAAEENHTSTGREWSIKVELNPGAQGANQELINWVTVQYAKAGWRLTWCANDIVFIQYRQDLIESNTSVEIPAVQ